MLQAIESGGSDEKAISRKRSARRGELGNVGGIRCRKAGAQAGAPPPPAYTWNGCYVGASAGTSSGSSQHFDVAGNAITNSFDLSGFIGGGQLGCNWQWGA
jgi:opacity protein-like surface antigen